VRRPSAAFSFISIRATRPRPAKNNPKKIVRFSARKIFFAFFAFFAVNLWV
jgi:hypothetical protein